jgi:hypothetical protein
VKTYDGFWQRRHNHQRRQGGQTNENLQHAEGREVTIGRRSQAAVRRAAEA